MIERYENAKISSIFSDEHKLALWQRTELAVIRAMTSSGVPREIFEEIDKIWEAVPIDINWWKKRDVEIHHDLNAFIDERVRHLPKQLQRFVHQKITSFDTEEPAFVTILQEAVLVIEELFIDFEFELEKLAKEHRHTIIMARTHGQEAELTTFGARVLSWIVDLRLARESYKFGVSKLKYSKISGAIGKYGAIEPLLEEKALGYMNLKPLIGATQIMPRVIYAPLAQGITNMVMVLSKIALDIRLMARSGRPLVQEPFGKKQKGSSAMPHKKNTIRTEQIEGMARMAKNYCSMIMDNIVTWEERAIEQSSVERIAWPDLFHVACRSFEVMNQVISGLKVYPDNMLEEVYEARGVYASAEAKEFLKERLAPLGGGYEDAYRIIQLACFNVFQPEAQRLYLRTSIASSYEGAKNALKRLSELKIQKPLSIENFILRAELEVHEALEADEKTVHQYNEWLRMIFSDPEEVIEWMEIFEPEYLLQHEHYLFSQIIGA